MPTPPFKPGFRISIIDCLVLLLGLTTAVATWISSSGWISLIITLAVAHFFLFCNVFRITRPSELLWAGTFILLFAITYAQQLPISITLGCIETLAVILIAREMKKPSYHGIFWQKCNPALPQWWQQQNESQMINTP